MNLFGVVFMIGWLIAAIAGEFAAINSLFKEMTRAFGRHYLVITPDLVIDMNRILMLNIPRIYFRKHMKNVRVEWMAWSLSTGKMI